MATDQERPPIPDPMKRSIRQRCGFGCVLCGVPLYEYHHMREWAEAQDHVEKDITLLCDRHHREYTNGLLSADQVAAADANPYNRRAGASPAYPLHFQGGIGTMILGGNILQLHKDFGAMNFPVIIDDLPMLGMTFDEDGNLLLRVTLFDEVNAPVLVVIDNELVYAPSPWDIEFVGARLVLRQAARKILLEIEFKPPDQVVISRARFMRNGAQVIVRPDSITVPHPTKHQVIRGNVILQGGAGVVIGPEPHPVSGIWVFDDYPRYGDTGVAARDWIRETFGNTPGALGPPSVVAVDEGPLP